MYFAPRSSWTVAVLYRDAMFKDVTRPIAVNKVQSLSANGGEQMGNEASYNSGPNQPWTN